MMQGLILAGGRGSRLAADGVETPKAVVEVGGRPQAVNLIETFAELGCETITCMIREGITIESPGPAVVRVCRTPSSLHTLVLGLGHLPPGDVFCSMVDTVMPTADWAHVYATSCRALANGTDAVLAVTPFIDDERPVFAACSDDQRVTSIGDETVMPPRVTGGVYALGQRARVAALAALAAGHSRVRVLLAGLVRQGYDVRAVEIAKIIDLDCRDDLEGANAWLEFCEGQGLPMG